MAIDYKQLRAGNLVFNHKGEVHVITPWDIWNFECMVRPGMHFDKRLEDWRYIPLDEGWLRKHEFKKDEYLNAYAICDNINLDEWLHPCTLDREGELITIGGALEFIHQAQNLTHGITGVELEVKL